MKPLWDEWNDPHNRKLREMYAEQDRTMQAQDRNRDAADLAALRAENERLNQIINVRTDDIVERAAENARLREALEAIDGMLDSPFPLSRGEEAIRSIARAALAPAAKE